LRLKFTLLGKFLRKFFALQSHLHFYPGLEPKVGVVAFVLLTLMGAGPLWSAAIPYPSASYCSP
jgi:hypothetical protein